MAHPEVPFGKQFRQKYFTTIDSDVTPVNHGSYGLTPTPVYDTYIKALSRDLSYPDRFVLLEYPREYRNSLQQLGEFLACDYRNLAIVDNATTGVNTVLQSFPFTKGDKVVILSTVYGSCGKTVEFLQEKIGIVPIKVTLNYPINHRDIISKIEHVFKTQGPIKLAMFDTVTSTPGVRCPFEAITKLCRQYNVLSLIDGAHSVGLIPIDLGQLKPDFYTSNLHKWLYVPRGCAVLYVDPKHHQTIQTLPISHSYVSPGTKLEQPALQNLLISKFTFIGSKNYSSSLCIKSALAFRSQVCGGEAAIRKYCHDLAIQVGDFIINTKWPNMTILNDEDKTLITSMVNIEVPFGLIAQNIRAQGGDADVTRPDFSNPQILQEFTSFSQNMMMAEYKTHVPLLLHNGKVYARFSCQIYNELSDYDYASDVVLKVFEKYFQTHKQAKL